MRIATRAHQLSLLLFAASLFAPQPLAAAEPAKKQPPDAEQWLRKFHTEIVRDQGEIIELEFFGSTGIWRDGHYTLKAPSDRELALLQQFKSLEKLRLANFRVRDKENITDAGLKHLGSLTQLESLTLDGLAITDAGLASLRQLKSLKQLSLGELRLTETGLVHLLELPSLASLRLSGMKLTEPEIVRLKKLKSLTELTFGRSTIRGPMQLADEWVVHFNDMTKLKSLSLRHTGISSAALAKLKHDNLGTLTLDGDDLKPFDLRGYRAELENIDLRGCTRLKTLTLTTNHLLSLRVPRSLTTLHFVNCQISDTALEHLKELPSLGELKFRSTTISPTGWAFLRDLDALESLDFYSTQINAEAIANLHGLKSLRSLSFDHTGISKQAGVENLKAIKSLKKLRLIDTGLWHPETDVLQKALPECKIEWDDSVLYAP